MTVTNDDCDFVALFETHRSVVFTTALRVCGTWADAEDLTAEAFLRAYRALREYDEERRAAIDPRPWVITILLNTWRNWQRDASRRPRTSPIASAPEPLQPGESVESAVIRREVGDELAGLLAELPEAQRVAIVLRHVVDLPVAEIAEIVGMKQGTVKSHISRGLGRLRTLYAPEEGADPMNTTDPLLDKLGGLRVQPSPDLIDRVAARYVHVDGPAGPVFVASTDHGVAYLRTSDAVGADPDVFAESYRQRFGRPIMPASRPPAGLRTALRTGRTASLSLDLRELSGFQRDVLLATRNIPRGELRPYGWIAAQVGRPRAARAVGSALGNNPVPLLIPCHRVTLSGGALGEYVFGQAVKESLLRGEESNIDEVRELARSGVHYLGSDTSGIVCFPSCVNARRITPEHRHGFRALAQAAAAGYRPCEHCRPGGPGP